VRTLVRGERGHLATQRLAAAGGGFQPERRANCLRDGADIQVAPATDEALYILEQAQFLGRIARHVAVATDAVAAARAAIGEEREDAVAEVCFGARAQTDDRAARREPDDFAGGD